jgi:hypothetical protein
LIVPLARRRGLAGRDNPLEPEPAAAQQLFEDFLRAQAGISRRRKQILYVHRTVFLGRIAASQDRRIAPPRRPRIANAEL